MPYNVPESLVVEYCRVCNVANTRALDDVDIGLLDESSYFVREEDMCILELCDEETFLRSFRGWNEVIHRLKHGEPKGLEMNRF